MFRNKLNARGMCVSSQVQWPYLFRLQYAAHWYLSKITKVYLETEAHLHHLSLRTFAEIIDNAWTLNFYGAILIALVTCFVFLRTLEIPFFNTIEEEEELIEEEEDPVPEVFDMEKIENDIPPPEFNITNEDSEEEVENEVEQEPEEEAAK